MSILIAGLLVILLLWTIVGVLLWNAMHTIQKLHNVISDHKRAIRMYRQMLREKGVVFDWDNDDRLEHPWTMN